MSVFSADEKQCKAATEPTRDGAQDFLSLPREILIDEICNYLPVPTLHAFLGQTCWAIRVEYYTPTSVFTPARPLEVYICVATQCVIPRYWHTVYLFLQAFAKSEAIPVSFSIIPCKDPPHVCHPRPLDKFNYVLCKLAVKRVDRCMLARFFIQYPSFGRISTIHLEGWGPLGPYYLPSKMGLPSVRTVHMSSIENLIRGGIDALAEWFPDATIEADAIDTDIFHRLTLASSASIKRARLTLEKMRAIDKVSIVYSSPDEIRDCIRRCVQLATGRIIIWDGAAGAWGDTLASELSGRGPINVGYFFYAHNSGSPAFAKYVTHVMLLQQTYSLRRFFSMSHRFTSVRHLVCQIAVQENVRISVTAPANIIVSATPSLCASTNFAFESPVPLQHSDLQCAVNLFIGIHKLSALSMDNWNETRKRVSREMAAVKLRFPQGYNPAWRLMYKIMSRADPDVLFVTGHV